MRYLLTFFLLLAAPDLRAQGPEAPTLSFAGTVIEVGSSQPMSGVKVEARSMILKDGQVGYGLRESMTLTAETKTDVSGAFSFNLPVGPYAFFAVADGYKETKPGDADLSNPRLYFQKEKANGADTKPTALVIRLGLQGVGFIEGQLVRAADELPLEGMTVSAMARASTRGHVISSGTFLGKSDAKGRFRIEAPPGKYFITASRPRENFGQRMMLIDEGAEPAAVEERDLLDYTSEELANAPYYQVLDRQTLSIGQVSVPKRKLAQVKIKIPKGICDAADKDASVELVRTDPGPDSQVVEFVAIGDLPCGKAGLVQNLSPGQYYLTAALKKPSEQLNGTADFRVTDGTLQETVPLGPALDVNFRIVREGGVMMAPRWDLVKAIMSSRVNGLSGSKPLSFDSKGDHADSLSPGRWQLLFYSLPPGHTVEKVVYNGQIQPPGFLQMEPAAPKHEVVVHLGTTQRRLTGVVKDRDEPLSKATVFIVRTPTDIRNAHFSAGRVTTDTRGHFEFDFFFISLNQGGSFGPGDYKVVACKEADVSKLDEPRALEALLHSAKRVEIKDSPVDLGTIEVARP